MNSSIINTIKVEKDKHISVECIKKDKITLLNRYINRFDPFIGNYVAILDNNKVYKLPKLSLNSRAKIEKRGFFSIIDYYFANSQPEKAIQVIPYLFINLN